MKLTQPIILTSLAWLCVGCVGNMNPTGNSVDHSPYFITTEPMVVKKIAIPVGTRLSYQESFFKKDEQSRPMPENKLTAILLPEQQYVMWGGVPVYMISKFFNSEMRGYSVYASSNPTAPKQHSRFAKLWQSCSDSLGVDVKDITDWRFKKANIENVESCSVIYQRYFKNDVAQQRFLDQLYAALQEVEDE